MNMTNELAKDRNRQASDRTLMAWIRTSMSLIGFGFAIAKSYDYIETDYMEKTGKVLDAIHTPTIFGAGFMLLGMFGLLAGVVQYRRTIDRLDTEHYEYSQPVPVPQIMAILLLVVGIFGFIAILL